MRKSILRFGALALMSLMSIGAWAQGGKVINGSFYDLRNDGDVYEATLITAADVADTWNKDWSSVKFDEKTYKITEVGAKAFAKVTTNKTVMFPTYVKIIGDYAFESMTIKPQANCLSEFDLANIDLGIGAFKGAKFNSGTLIDLGNKETVADNLFNGCTGISTISLDSEGLKTVGKNAFKDCSGLNFFGYKKSGKYYLPITLNEVKESAFSGCSGLEYFEYEGGRSHEQIKKVGKEAFLDCKWLTNAVFANVCGSFGADFTYAEGSFSGCGLTDVDLTNSTVTVSEIVTTGSPRYKDVLGVPAYAFYGNKIKNLKLPKSCIVIEKGAFASNYNTTVSGAATTYTSTLAIPTLPSALKFIEDEAFDNSIISGVSGTLSPKEQNNLYLPNDFVEIGKDAFKNRTIAIVYAYPTFNTMTRSVPTLDNSNKSSITATVVPVVAPWTLAGGSSTNVKAQYEAKNWSGVRYATLKTTDPVTTTVTYNDVVYTIGAQTDGVYAVTPKTYNLSEITIPGMFDNSVATSIKSEGGNGCQYAVVFKVNMPIENVIVKSGVNVTSLTFNPDTREGDVANTFSGASYTEIPTCAVANCSAKLEEVTFGEGVNEVAAAAFKSFEKLTKVNLGSVTKVGDNAFEGTGITAIDLPRSLATIGQKSFNTTKLKTVTVSYDATSGTNLCPIPAIITTANNETFNAATKVLVVSDGKGTATREDYLAASTWAQFFDNTVTVKVKKGAETNATRLATKDEQVTTGGVTTWKRYYELVDAGNASEITSVSISNADGTTIPVKYVRDFSEAGINNFQCWYVPFEYKHNAGDGCTFYYIYDTKQIGEGADATTSIELKEVKNDEGKDFATIKANLPYVVKPSKQEVTFEAEAILNTPETAVALSFTNVVNLYTFTGTYEKKPGDDTTPFYSLYASDGALHPFKANGHIWAYRFYLDIAKRTGENPYGLVKFVVLDDEDATSIEDVKANSLTAPMFDLMGRQITSPAKGQVYIQNGVKKLAK